MQWFIDGSSENTKGDRSAAGVGLVCPEIGIDVVWSGEGTNNMAELTACELGASLCGVGDTLVTDSQYVVRIVNGEAMARCYQERWTKLLAVLKERKVTVLWCRGHDSANHGNARADKLAKQAMQRRRDS